MPTTVVRYICDICGQDWDTLEEAIDCEKLGIPTHDFEVGDRFMRNKRNVITILEKMVHQRMKGKDEYDGFAHTAAYKVDLLGKVAYHSNAKLQLYLADNEWDYVPANKTYLS